MLTEELKLSQVTVNSSNPRTISKEKFDKLINSILVFPKMLELRPVVIDDMTVVLGGNMRYRALSAISEMSAAEINMKLAHGCKGYAQKTEAERQNLRDYWKAWLENPTVTIVRADQLSEEQKREFIIKDNVGYGEWDMDMLANEWPAEDLDDWGLDVWQEPTDGEGGGMETNSAKEGSKDGSLNERFVVPPFSILDTRKGYWQARKKLWRDIIGDMGESRNDTLITSPEIKYKDLYLKTRKHREELGITFKEYLEKYVSDEVKEREASKVLSAGVSLLDPVMAEIVCKWFGTQGCKTFDCFAGDSVFGYVSAYLGNEFTGVELRPEQAEINNARVEGMSAHYINDDGQNVGKHIAPHSQDLLFSCPPYFDLEVYSDLPNDASNQGSYEDFIGILRNAFTAALGCLKDDRFAVIVVGDVRNKKTGCYYDFCGDIKRIFRDNGAELYNEIILVETGASTALRAGRYMESRKVAKMHQNILVFYKGNTKNIKSNFPKIEYASEDLEQFRVDSGNEPDGDTE
jgi:DNA modification methylase